MDEENKEITTYGPFEAGKSHEYLDYDIFRPFHINKTFEGEQRRRYLQ